MTTPAAELSTLDEANRPKVIQEVIDRRLTIQVTAQRPEIPGRQCRHPLARHCENDPPGMVSRRRGKAGNHQLPQGLTAYALSIIRECCNDFDPTLACGRLPEIHGVHLPKETVHKSVTQASLWVPRKQRASKIQQPCYRHVCAGEFIQIDGCDHHWFESRGPKCTALTYVDDAASHLMQLRFIKSESTFTYSEAARGYIEKHGKLLALYGNKASAFRVNDKNVTGGDGDTRFGRTMYELNIQIICAKTSAARGHAERAYQILQDRLVKELRLRDASTTEATDAFVEEFMNDHNRRFSRTPRQEFNAHQEPDVDNGLGMVLIWRGARHASKSLTVQYDRVLYLIEDSEFSRRVTGKYIDIWYYSDGHKEPRLDDISLLYSTYSRLSEIDQGTIVDNKRLGRALEMAQLVQAERDNNRSRSVPSGGDPSHRRKAPMTKRSQRSLDQDDMFSALVKLQSRSEEISGRKQI